jgi:hypothetical protein
MADINQKRLVEWWNIINKRGARVRYQDTETTTRSIAYLHDGKTALVLLQGHWGGVPLEEVTAL